MLRKNKIAGISFHHRSSKKFAKHRHSLQEFFNLEDLHQQIQRETPIQFTNKDIRRFLYDHGRNEINSQISQCIDFSAKWTGVLKVIERCFPDKYFLNPAHLIQPMEESSHLTSLSNEIEIYLLIKRLIGLWKHNLNILEMAAQAQYFVRN